ncbi:MAG: DNA repair protein RecN [Cytophagaceae bacterium SCN 52-12]|nr:MAG: DNA repair protein RecN [Cytophagaceae bacterium SCN 52-12]
MLTHLFIRNYVLIDGLELDLSPGLTIITGETGAGKSILLGAIGLLLGQRSESRVLFSNDTKCIIEGTFDISGYKLEPLFAAEELDYSAVTIIRREITPTGKSRAFINDTPVTLDLLRRITGQLVDIHSQHDSILLGNGAVQVELLDAFAGNEQKLTGYRKAYEAYRKAEESLARLKEEAGHIRKEHDYNLFLWQELAAADLQAGEIEALENELGILENASEIKSRFHGMHQLLDGQEISVLSLLNEASQMAGQVNRLVPAYEALFQRLGNTLLELKDLTSEIEDIAENVEVNEERISRVSERLDLLYLLLKKHHSEEIPELTEIRDQLRQKIDKFENLDAELREAAQHMESARALMLEAGKILSQARREAAPRFENLVTGIARELGITHAVFTVALSDAGVPGGSGLNRIEFLFSANKGLAPQPLKAVASGGEFSRLMLAFKYVVAGKKQLPTLIFDEIDSGISGEIARKMGEILKQMGRRHQLIAITHLHQIAAFGNEHLYVYKDDSSDTTVSKIKRLSDGERVQELAQMIGGRNPSESVIANARELLEKSL